MTTATRGRVKIPLKYFEKLEVLTPSQKRYLLEYSKAVGNCNDALQARIMKVLEKKVIPDPIFSKYVSAYLPKVQTMATKKEEKKKKGFLDFLTPLKDLFWKK